MTKNSSKSTENKDRVFLRQATDDDVIALEQLLNRCYRQSEGWTNEADLVGGIRTTQAELAKIVADPKHYFFVYPKTTTEHTDALDRMETSELLGCIAVEFKENDGASNDAYIGMFAVHPQLQGQGVGNVILEAAETFGRRHLLSDKRLLGQQVLSEKTVDKPSANKKSRLTMSILSHRPELLSYYQRRGYQLTGHSDPFPVDGNNGEPKRKDLQLLELEKLISD